MRISRGGVISIPIKLAVSLMIIVLMVPPISALAESIQDDIQERELHDAADDLKGRICQVYSKGPSYVTHTEIIIPDGCHLAIGGEQSTSIRMYRNGELAGWLITDVPVGGDELVMSGSVLLEISNDIGDTQQVMVREI